MEDDKIVGYVTAYLKKKGFTQTEKIFQEEFQHNKTTNSSSSNSLLEPDIANHLLAFSQYFSPFSNLLSLPSVHAASPHRTHFPAFKPYVLQIGEWSR